VVQYCVTPENQYIFATASGYIPVNVACEDLEEMQTYYAEKPQYKVALEAMKAANPLSQESVEPTYNEINGIITEKMLEFCQGNLTIDEVIDVIVSQSNASLDEYYEAN
jgi:sn-glycerol 3-phosphate transport system substrate-binding protein